MMGVIEVTHIEANCDDCEKSFRVKKNEKRGDTIKRMKKAGWEIKQEGYVTYCPDCKE